MAKKYLVRYLLADGTTAKAGGYGSAGAASACVERLMSEAVRDTRATNGALAIVSAWATDPDGAVVAQERQLGPFPQVTA